MNVASAPVVDPPDDESADLLAVATRVADQAGADEQVEAFVGRSSYTTVRVHGGEVESFTAATSAGIGVRVVRDHRQGFAWAGSLDDDVIADVTVSGS